MSSLKPYILIVALVFPLAALVIGSRYLDECPVQPMVPVYLIVRGVLSVVLHILNVVGHFPDVGEMESPCHDTRTKVFMTLNLVSLIWFIAGCYWVYGVYEPSFERQDGPEYCHPTLYQFAYWVVNLSFIVLLVYLALIAINLSKRVKDAKVLLCLLVGPGRPLNRKAGQALSGQKEEGTVEEKAAMAKLTAVCVVDSKNHKLMHSVSASSFFK